MKCLRYLISLLVLTYSLLSLSNALALHNKIVTVVNNQVITSRELDMGIDTLLKQAGSNMDRSKARQLVLDGLINSALLLSAAERAGITINSHAIDAHISAILKNNHLTLAQLKTDLAEKYGITLAEFREQLRKQETVRQYQQAMLGRSITLSEPEIAAAYQQLKHRVKTTQLQYQLTDIVITLPEAIAAPRLATLKNLAYQLMAELNRGGALQPSLNHVKNKLATGETIVSNDLGWRSLAELPELFVKSVATLEKPGQTTGPIMASNGLHILQLNNLQTNSSTPASPISITKEQATNFAYEQKIQQKTEALLKELRARAYINQQPSANTSLDL